MNDVNLWAVLTAAVSSFLLGGLWYSRALFGVMWHREAGGGEKKEGSGHLARVFGVSFLFALIAAFAFAVWLGPKPELRTALIQGLVAGSCIVATSFGINYQFASRSVLMWLIDGGYHTAQFVLFALVLALWP